MLLSLVLHMYSMRCVLPAAVLLGTAPTYVLAWGAWRLLSAFLPSRVYQEVDDRLYCVYQSMVLFFFENYTGVQVRGTARRPRPPAAHASPLSTWVPAGNHAARAPPPTPGYFRIFPLCLADPAPNIRAHHHPILEGSLTFLGRVGPILSCRYPRISRKLWLCSSEATSGIGRPPLPIFVTV